MINQSELLASPYKLTISKDVKSNFEGSPPRVLTEKACNVRKAQWWIPMEPEVIRRLIYR